MTDHSALKQLRDTQISTCTQAADDALKLSTRLGEVSQRLATVSQRVIEHIDGSAPLDEENARILWHDLNGVEHLVEQFSLHATESLRDFKEHAQKLLVALREQRQK